MRMINVQVNIIILLGLTVLLSSCGSYYLSEATLNEEIKKQLPPSSHIFVTIGDNVAKLDMLITGLHIDLLAENGGTAKIYLSTNTAGEFMTYNSPLNISAYLSITVYSGLRLKNGKIYLVNPTVESLHIQGEKFGDGLLRTVLGSFHREVESALSGYFYKHPIYELGHSSFEKNTKNKVKAISIKENELLFEF